MKSLIKKVLRFIKSDFAYVFSGGVLSKLIAFFSSIIVVRLVDKNSYAALAYADNILFYITLISGFGMSSAILKFCVDDCQCKNKAYYFFAFKWGNIFHIILLVFTCFFLLIAKVPFYGAKKLVIMLMPYSIVYYWFSLFQSFLRTQFENKKYAISSFIQVFLTFMLSIIFVLIMGISGIAFARFFALVGSIIIFGHFIRNYFQVNKKYALEKKEIIPFIITSLSFLISNFFSMVMPANEAFLINNLIGEEIVSANYKVANLIPSQLPFITSTIVLYYFPIFAKNSLNKNIWKEIIKVGKNTFLINLAITCIGVLLTPFIINIVYGNEYSDANYLSKVLWWVYFFNAGFRMIPMNILPALGYIKFNVIVSILSAIIHFFVDYIFIKYFGISGAVFATGGIYVLTGILYWLYLFKKVRTGGRRMLHDNS